MPPAGVHLDAAARNPVRICEKTPESTIDIRCHRQKIARNELDGKAILRLRAERQKQFPISISKTEGRSGVQRSEVLIAVSRVFSKKKPSQNTMSRRAGEE